MKPHPILALAAGALLLCTGCSYKALDEQIQQTVHQAQPAVQQAAAPDDPQGNNPQLQTIMKTQGRRPNWASVLAFS